MGLKHQKEKRSLDHFEGLDVSVKDTSVCIVDDTGKIIRDRRNRFCTLPKHGFRQAMCFDPIIGAMMLKALVDEHKLLGQFRHECRLLRSLSGGDTDIARTPQNGCS
jgi:hypothetical protein